MRPAKRDLLLLGLGATLFGALVYACLPPRVVPLDDDFGYLRSVIATLQHGRPWTDDWLEPWAASLSALSALLYLATGSFHLATYGLLAALAAVSFGLCALLLRRWTGRTSAALGLAAAELTFPTLFWKTVQFTGLALYLPGLFGAVLAAERRRWGWFALAWSLALAARQSALAWIGLPLAASISAWRRRDAGNSAEQPGPPAWAALAGIGVYLALKLTMNHTHAQAVITDHLLARASCASLVRSAMVGGGVFLGAAGLGFMVGQLTRPVAPRREFRSTAVVAGLALLAIGLLMLDVRSFVQWEQPMLSGPLGFFYFKALVLAGVLGWTWRGLQLRAAPATCAGLSLGLIALRGAVWDYYFIDAAILGFFGSQWPDVDSRHAA